VAARCAAIRHWRDLAKSGNGFVRLKLPEQGPDVHDAAMTEGDVVEQPRGTSIVGSDRQRQRCASRKSSNFLSAPFFWPR
jgi:hypothetical protein